MAIEYREWSEGDDLALLEIWGGPETLPAEQFRAALAPSSNSGKASLGADASWPKTSWTASGSRWRPAWSTRPPCTRNGSGPTSRLPRTTAGAAIGATLLTMLRREAEKSPSGVTKLRSKVEPGTAGAAFAEWARACTRSSVRSLVVVEPEPLRLPVLATAPKQAASEQVEDLATGSVELSDVVGRYYTAVHHWDNPGELGIPTVQRLFLDDLTGAHGAIVLRAPKASAFGSGVPATRKGKMQAFAISYAQGSSDEPSDVFLGHDPLLPTTRRAPQSGTCWRSLPTSTLCCWKWTIP